MNERRERNPITSTTRFEILKRGNFKCHYCGRPASETVLHVDHVIPISLGGTDELHNLVSACVDCNLGKAARPISEKLTKVNYKKEKLLLNKRRSEIESASSIVEMKKKLLDEEVNQFKSTWRESAKALGLGINFSEPCESPRLYIKKHGLKLCLEIAQRILDENSAINEPDPFMAFQRFKKLVRYEGDPEMERMAYLMAIICNRCREYEIPILRNRFIKCANLARTRGVGIEKIINAAKKIDSLNWFESVVNAMESSDGVGGV